MDSNRDFATESFGKMQLSESVASYLREQIISGKLAKGEFLRIDALAKTLGMSSTPIREGLLLLQSESFVRLIPRRGFVVTGFSMDDLRDLFWAQAVVGAELAARAANKMTKADVAKLQQIQNNHDTALAAGDRERVTRLGHEFHRFINLAAQSPRLTLLLGSLAKQLPNRFYTSIEGQLQGAVQYHPIIIDAIKVKDSEAVRSLMYRHIVNGGEHLVAMLDSQGKGKPQGDRGEELSADPAGATGTEA
ncbi:GntR family transcriptional regulator [Caballeronia zhejiangensis]|uniref:GntR family transcriptional regulator n=1 Tax=Caballeronia zhejiangensis TaxID=871203 RepID=UPI001EF4AFD2|nr:GntR family transcriptional regulator [Caballeronia zhejiangensis]MCG7400324.1 GntR family transcriptional regulator [Caballeronia zhejiangensis]